MKKWEYHIEDLAFTSMTNETRFLDNMGEKGWELVSVVDKQYANHFLYRYYFKRPKPE